MVQVREIPIAQRNTISHGYEESNGVSDSEYTDIEEDQGETNSTSWYGRWLPTSILVPFRDPRGWSRKAWNRFRGATRWMGKIAWIFTTSMLLVGLPVLFAYDREKALQEQQLLSLPHSSPS